MQTFNRSIVGHYLFNQEDQTEENQHKFQKTSVITMEFKKYNSIENSYREKYLQSIHDKGLDNAEHEYAAPT